MSLIDKLFLLIVGLELVVSIDHTSVCITDCTYHEERHGIPKDGLYCATNEKKTDKSCGTNEAHNEWTKLIPCKQNRPLVNGTQVPYLYHYQTIDEKTRYSCNGKCGKWLNSVYKSCFNDDYTKMDICNAKQHLYDKENLWLAFTQHLKLMMNESQGLTKQLSSSPLDLGIADMFKKLENGPAEFYQFTDFGVNSPINKYISVFSPGSESIDEEVLTAAMFARIYAKHIRNLIQCPNSTEMTKRFESLSPNSDDVAQVILRTTLGGTLDLHNVIPSVPYIKVDDDGKMTFNQQLAFIVSMEKIIHKFLQKNPVRYVEWTALLWYGDIMYTYRPKAIFHRIVFKNPDDSLHVLKTGLLKDKSQIEFIVDNERPNYVEDVCSENYN